MGTRAFSHDSIFIPDGGAESEQTVQAMSQDNILGKVKTLQQQLGKNIKFGQPPLSAIPMKKADSGEASLEEDLFLTSPMEIVTQQDIVLSDTENKSSETPSSLSPLNLSGAGSEMEEKVAPVKPSRPKRHFSSAGTIESVNLDAIPLAIARLDNSAAKHKLSVKPKKQRVSKKHRRLAPDRQNEQGDLEGQPSLNQNGHPREDKQICHGEEPEPLDSEEEKRHQEEYWQELEAKCKRQKAEAAERRRLEEQRLQALERRLWEENRRQQLLEEEGEEEEGKKQEPLLDVEVETGQQEEERWRWEELGGPDPEGRKKEEKQLLETEEQQHLREEARRLEEKRRQQEEVEMQTQWEAERQWREKEERRLGELRRLEELEAQRRQEEEEQRRQVEEDKLMMERRRLEELEVQRRREEEERRREEEERRQEELRHQEEQRRQEEEEQRLREREEKRMKELKREEELEEQRRQEEEEQRLREREEKRMKELKREEELEEQRRQAEVAKLVQEEEVRRQEELKKQEEMELQRRQEAEKKHQEALQRRDEERRLEREKKRGLWSPLQNDFEEKPGEQENVKAKKQRESSEEPRIDEKQRFEAKPSREQQGKRGYVHGDDHRLLLEKREEPKSEPPQKKEGPKQEILTPVEKKEAVTPEADRKVEELRWQEVDERQTMPRPYTFQVSSGGKQILFPKVNLTPVTPGKDTGLVSAPLEPKAHKASPASHTLPSTLSIPHTAILVTGAQLCGPAVNLNQIKDTACKSLLGLSEEKKHMDLPTVENPPRAPSDSQTSSGKAKPPQKSLSSGAALAEWASIRSRILKTADSDQRAERDQRSGDELTPRGRCDSRGNLRKTPPLNAKFSIMPAWQKFSDGGMEISKHSTEAESIQKRPVSEPSEESEPLPPATGPHEHQKSPEKLGVHQEPTDTTEGCKFAKDLPSFLVPSLPSPPQKMVTHTESVSTSESETTSGNRKPDHMMAGGEEKASPFGIKLRRTNYSLRFHCDQQTEQKKKKRHSSTGDSAEGGPSALESTGGEKETGDVALKHGSPLTQGRKPSSTTRKDSTETPSSHSPPVSQPGPPPLNSQTPAADHDKVANKMSLVQKPALAPKPTSQTPPSSPLSKLSRPYLVELLARRAAKPDTEPSERAKESQESSDTWPPSPPPPEERKGQKKEEEEELPERKPSSPALPAACQEKPSQTREGGRKENLVLQSRHSLDGSKLMEKAETAQPLWVTLALQKQKGFREQQATREERKQAREAKQAEKLSKENVSVSPQPESGSVSRAGSLHKSPAQPAEERKPETAVARLERREQLKKASTLPTSVTVEISDSAPPAPLVKEVTKRFSTPDTAPVSTEPAWLALAKRKAKAWSDCPQIIK
ncbi:capping protein-inhibiting regulator of actin dynamics [Orycteropus afer afer]|uniref:Capping protein-inhibiting regulator of actin dynamics n=1 Tax=Orycteropus afer afer TaxID=1230840 RepID=A0AC54Z866_ORYAF|nr:capping protein-inhibiting regulator of actin dynamics [Orycteropus afer afer]